MTSFIRKGTSNDLIYKQRVQVMTSFIRKGTSNDLIYKKGYK